jgi:hypothetical protein
LNGAQTIRRYAAIAQRASLVAVTSCQARRNFAQGRSLKHLSLAGSVSSRNQSFSIVQKQQQQQQQWLSATPCLHSSYSDTI